MSRLFNVSRPFARTLSPRATPGSGGPLTRALGLAVLVLLASVLITNLTLDPNKRNIEITAAVIFVGIVLIANPRKALFFTLLVVPYPAYTTVGSTSTLLILALAGLILLKSRELEAGEAFIDRRMDAALLGFALVVVISLYQVPRAEMGHAALKMQGMIASICLFYVMVRLINTKQHLIAVMDTVCIAAASLYLIAFLQSLFPDRAILPEFFKFSAKVATMGEIRRGEVRVFATFPGYELFAEFVVLTLYLQYYRLRHTKDLNRRLLRLLVIFLGLGVLFATATRGGMIMLLIGWLILLVAGRGIVAKKDLFQVAFVALALFYLSLPFLGDYYALMLDRLTEMTEGQDMESLNGRTEVFSQALEGIARSPFLGHGFYSTPGMFRGHVSMNIHNLYLDLGYKLGIPGLLLFFTFVASLMTNAWRYLRNRAVDPEIREALLFLLTMICMFLMDEFKIEFTRDPLPMQTTFTMFALAAAAIKIAKAQTRT